MSPLVELPQSRARSAVPLCQIFNAQYQTSGLFPTGLITVSSLQAVIIPLHLGKKYRGLWQYFLASDKITAQDQIIWDDDVVLKFEIQ
jgi:hypothetical protein